MKFADVKVDAPNSKTNNHVKYIFAITETLLKDNEKVNIQHLSGQDSTGKIDGGDVAFLIKKSIIKLCTIEPNLNKTIKFVSIKLNLTNNESVMVYIMANKNLGQQRIRK